MQNRKWLASDLYLDNGQWCVLDYDNHIIVGVSAGLTAAQAREIADAHNRALDEAQQALDEAQRDAVDLIIHGKES